MSDQRPAVSRRHCRCCHACYLGPSRDRRKE